MSRWLQSVNSLLEKLDDRVEIVAEERATKAQDDDDDEVGVADDAGLVDILAKRGLSSVASNDDDDDDDGDEGNDGDAGRKEEEAIAPEVIVTQEEAGDTVPPVASATNDASTGFVQDGMRAVATVEDDSMAKEGAAEHGDLRASRAGTAIANESASTTQSNDREDGSPNGDGDAAASGADRTDKTTGTEAPSWPTAPASHPGTSSKAAAPPRSAPPEADATAGTPPRRAPSTAARPPAPSPTPKRTERERELTTEMKEAQKEARTLRRHVVALNEQLEAAESELQAQRKELERAAERMEKDRLRTKEEKEAGQKRHAQELALLKAQHETSLTEQQVRMEVQLEGYRQKLLEEESRRRQEGGDWDKEIAQAIDREQSMRQQVSALEDEKAVLLSHVSTLQGQQVALGSRLESLTQAADNADKRERDAEDRLDAALNQHARQISQRQAREAELERTLQELNAALVASKNRSSNGRVSRAGGGGVEAGISNFVDARVSALEMDLESANSQLELERERSETLQMQLRDLSKETTQEATMVHAKHIQYDRQIADMSLTISKLEASLREAERMGPMDSNASENFVSGDETAKQIKMLSEEVVRLRDKLASLNSESLAMKHRLRAATERANTAEEELMIARSSSNGDPDQYDAMERANTPSGSRRRKVGAAPSGSIRTAMRLESGHGERSEQIGQVVDAVDSFAVSTGKYLRKNPLARAGFIFYLILIHLWTFALLFFHAHSFDTERGDLRSAIGASHGPHVLMMKQNQAQVVKSVGAFGHADASAAISNVDIDKRGNQVNAEIIKAQGADEPVGAAAAEANSGNGA